MSKWSCVLFLQESLLHESHSGLLVQHLHAAVWTTPPAYWLTWNQAEAIQVNSCVILYSHYLWFKCDRNIHNPS